MYKLTKPKGYTTVVTITNMEDESSINIGNVTVPMLSILDEAGILPLEEDSPRGLKEWDFTIEKDLADKLFPLAMRMSKPVRHQKKTSSEKTEVNNNEIDAMDVLLGLAHYSK